MKAGDKIVCEYPSRTDKGAVLRVVYAEDEHFYLEWIRGLGRKDPNRVTKRTRVSRTSANAHWRWARELPRSIPHRSWSMNDWRQTRD